MGEVPDPGGSNKAPDHLRCCYLVRLKDDEGRPMWDDDDTPMLRQCRRRMAREVPSGNPDHDLCMFHLNDSPTQAAITQGKVDTLLREMDLGPNPNPIDGLLEAVRHAGGMVRLLRLLVGGLDTEPIYDTLSLISPSGELVEVKKPGGIWGWDKDNQQAPNVLVTLYGGWLDRYAKCAKMCSDAGLDERIVRNAEATAGGLFTALQRALERVSLTHEQQAELRHALGQELRAMEGVILQIPAAISVNRD